MKQNKTEKISYYTDSPLPKLIYTPPSSEIGMLDQFVLQQLPPITQIPLNFDSLHLNPVLRLLKCMQLVSVSLSEFLHSNCLFHDIAFLSPHTMSSFCQFALRRGPDIVPLSRFLSLPVYSKIIVYYSLFFEKIHL